MLTLNAILVAGLICMPTSVMEYQLSVRHEEHKVIELTRKQFTYSIWVNRETQAWTMVETLGDMSCLFRVGKGAKLTIDEFI